MMENCFGPGPDRVFNENLARLRAQYPFLEINPTPVTVLSLRLVNGQAQDIALPNGTKMVRFSGIPIAGARPECGVSFVGKASLAGVGDDPCKSSTLWNPQGWFYTGGGVSKVSLICNQNDMVLSIQCHIQQG